MATHQSIIKSVKPVILGILCGLVTASAVWDLLRPIIYNYSVQWLYNTLPDIIPDPSVGGCTLPDTSAVDKIASSTLPVTMTTTVKLVPCDNEYYPYLLPRL